jgi:hypothetical protein
MTYPVAYFIPNAWFGSKLVCVECAKTEPTAQRIPLYFENIAPYKQTCHQCGKTVVEPRSQAWPVLFPKPEIPKAPNKGEHVYRVSYTAHVTFACTIEADSEEEAADLATAGAWEVYDEDDQTALSVEEV